MNINKKFIVDRQGKPKEAIIPIEDFIEMEEILGWDLDEEAVQQLRNAKKDRERGKKEAYIDLNSI
jgi:PHD/YefM family antitoxin component YafN of YafNO toxin-antitoxin module